MISNGDLLWRRTEASTGANHYGIAVWLPRGLHVIHRQKANDGVVEPMDKFLKGFQLRGSKRTPLSESSTSSLVQRFDNWLAGKFELATNNCEHYAYRFAGLRQYAPDTTRRTYFIIAITITLIVLYLSTPKF